MTYTVGGSVTGLVGSGLILSLNDTEQLPIDADGAFEFTLQLPEGASYEVIPVAQPSTPDQTCSVFQGSGVMPAGAVTDIEVFCPAAPASTGSAPQNPFIDLIGHIFQGSGAQQTGVDDGTIEAHRATVVSGRVIDELGNPLQGATVSVLGRTEFGQTLTDGNGEWMMAVNGGQSLVFDLAKDGLLPSQRRVDVPWNVYVHAPQVMLIALSPVVTTIAANAGTPIVGLGATTDDDRGQRLARLRVDAGTDFDMVLADGSRLPLPSMAFRVTEYTVGPDGPERMPGTLPPLSGYTYAMELSADEAIAAGAAFVELSQPAYFYLDNFLEFPVGEIVPHGYYDRLAGLWIPADNGLVMEVIAESGGSAVVDVDGDGVADTGTALSDLGIDAAELITLAEQFEPGERRWRLPVTQVTPHDPNWPIERPEDADPPPEDEEEEEEEEDDPCDRPGSIIECQTRVLGEQVPLAGSEVMLHYRSNRVPGFLRALTADITVTNSELAPTPPTSIQLLADIAGVTHLWLLPVVADQEQRFVWDRKDAFGRVLQGRQTLLTELRYLYQYDYVGANGQVANAFGAAGNGVPIQSGPIVGEIQTSAQLLGLWDARGAGLGGWTLSGHHVLDRAGGVLYRGDGRQQREIYGPVIDTLAELSGEAYGLTAAPDGSLLLTRPGGCDRVWRVTTEGNIEIPANLPDPCMGEDFDPTRAMQLANGDIIFIETDLHRISRLNADGTFEVIAGDTGNFGYSGDDGPAVDALLRSPRGAALGPDGALYFSDTWNYAVRRIRADGIIETFAGGNGRGYSGDGGQAQDAQLAEPGQLAFGPDGSLVVVDQGQVLGAATGTTRGVYIRRISPSGEITTIAGDGSEGGVLGRPVESGVPATSTGIDAESIVVLDNGDVVFSELLNEVVRRVDSEGNIHTIAGMANVNGHTGDGGPATSATFWSPIGLAVLGDGSIAINDQGFTPTQGWRVRRMADGAFGVERDDTILLPREDGAEVYEFNQSGLHLTTYDGLTGVVIRTFSYDEDGRLDAVIGPFGPVVTIARPDASTVTLTTRLGYTTTLLLDGDGWVSSVVYPDGESLDVTHAEDGLLMAFGDFRGNTSTFTYTELGELETDTNRMSATATLSEGGGDGLDIVFNDFVGQDTIFRTRTDEFGDRLFERIEPWSGITASVDALDGLAGVVLEDGTEVDTGFSPGPRWGGAVEHETLRQIELPDGLTRIETKTVTAVVNNDDPLDTQMMTITTDHSGASLEEHFDASSMTRTSTTAEGVVTTTSLDTFGRTTVIATDPAIDDTILTYNAAGDLESVVQGASSVTQTYDANHRLIGVTNSAGLTETYTHDANGNRDSILFKSGRLLSWSMDTAGRLSTLTMPDGDVHTLGYHPNGALASYAAPGHVARTFASRANGQLAGMTLEDGRTATRTFDATGRSTGWTYPEATLVAGYLPNTSLINTSTWTPTGGIGQVLDTQFNGSLPTQFAWTGVAQATVDLDWNNRFEWVGSTLNSGPTRVIGRDDDGRKVADGDFSWTRQNPRRAWDTISDATATLEQTLDSLGRTATRTLTVNGVNVHQQVYSWRNDRRLSTVAETVVGTSETRDYVYDDDQRLSAIEIMSLPVEAYAYDGNDNLTSSTIGAVVTGRSYDDQDRMTQIGSTPVTVDTNGHTTAIGTDQFVYDTRGQLLESNIGGAVTEYHYDGLGRRVARTDSGGTTTYVYGDPEREFRVTAVQDSGGTWIEYYYAEDELVAADIGADRYYVATDATGSPRVVADDTGTVVKVVDYSAFGEVLADSNSALELHIGFAGGLRDPASGLLNFGLRDYHPALARWMRRDPALFGGGSMNLYAYVANDPVNHIDRTGLGLFGTAPGSASAEGYNGVGGGLSLQYDGDGTYGICVKFGVGTGFSASYDSGGRPETYYEGEVGTCIGEASRRWVKCPPGSKRKGYWETIPPSPGLGPIGFGPDGPTFAPGVGCSNRIAFEACADI